MVFTKCSSAARAAAFLKRQALTKADPMIEKAEKCLCELGETRYAGRRVDRLESLAEDGDRRAPLARLPRLPALRLLDRLQHFAIAEREHLSVDVVPVGHARDLNAVLLDHLFKGRHVVRVDRGLAA